MSTPLIPPTPPISPAPQNLFLQLQSFSTKDIAALETMVHFIQDANPGANINEVSFKSSIGAKRILKDGEYKNIYNMVAFDGQSYVEDLLGHLASLSTESVKRLYEHTKIDLSQSKAHSIYAFNPEIPLSAEENRQLQRGVFSAAEVEIWKTKLIHQETTLRWASENIFYSILAYPSHNEKIKFLVLETKKAFENKPEEFELFKKTVLKQSEGFFHNAFAQENFELLDFLMEELDFDINHTFKEEPLFFAADNEKKIAYIVDQGADFTLVNQRKETFTQKWTPKPEGKTVLTLLNAKSVEAVNLPTLLIEFLKKQKNVAEIKELLNKIGKKEKIKNKALIQVDNQTALYQGIRFGHWKFVKSMYEGLAASDENFEKNLFNEVDTATQSVPAFLYILRSDANAYDSNDKRAERKKFLLKKSFQHMDWPKFKSSENFMKIFTHLLSNAPFNFLDKNDLTPEFRQALQKFGVVRNEEFFKRLSTDTRYNTRSLGYSSSPSAVGLIKSEFLSYFIDEINLSSKDLLSLIVKNFIYPKGEKPLTGKDNSILFFMEIAKRTLTPEDKDALVLKYIEGLEKMVAEREEEVKKYNSEKTGNNMEMRLNNYSYKMQPASSLLLAFLDYEGYNFPASFLPLVQKLYQIVPINDKRTLSLLEEETWPKLEKQVMENSLKNLLPPTNTSIVKKPHKI